MNLKTGVDRRRQEVRLWPGKAREVQREPHGGAAGLGGRVRADGEGGEGKEKEERRRLRSMICLNQIRKRSPKKLLLNATLNRVMK